MIDLPVPFVCRQTPAMPHPAALPMTLTLRHCRAPLHAPACAALLLMLAGTARAQVPCVAIEDDAARLSCYDAAAGRTPVPGASSGAAQPALRAPAGASAFGAHTGTSPSRAAAPMPAAAAGTTGAGLAPGNTAALSLSHVWELDAADKQGTFRIVPHRANYLLPVRASNRANTQPFSPAPDHQLIGGLAVEPFEAKFQLSFKAKAFENVFGDNGDVWVAYTQQSNWQVYNSRVSSPFRETDYEPEVILALRTDAEILGWRWRLLNLGLVHESNGRPNPLSRSWNRVYAQFGFERGPWTLHARPWYRIPEGSDSDDNPDIRRYMGSGDVRLSYADRGHIVSALGRYSTSGRRGALQLEWAFPLSGALKGYMQMTTGYGESLIDYNHAQTTFGVGVLLLPWQ